MVKAKPTGFKIYNGRYSTFVEYEYRGMNYEVEYANDMSYCVTSPRVQHENAQAEIDKVLGSPTTVKPHKYEDTAEYGFNLFWEYVNQ